MRTYGGKFANLANIFASIAASAFADGNERKNMKKTFMGVRLKRLREERGLTQIALARALELSPSYLNQLEQNQRPLTVPVLLKLNAVFGVDVQLFSEDDEARLIADLREVFSETTAGEAVALAEIRELATNMPAVARSLLRLAKNQRASQEREEALAARLGLDRSELGAAKPMPFEEVRDFFYARHNHIAELDELAERLAAAWLLRPGEAAAGLETRLGQAHGVRVARAPWRGGMAETQRHFDAAQKILTLSPHLTAGQAAFQMATQIAFLEAAPQIDAIAGQAGLDEAFGDLLPEDKVERVRALLKQHGQVGMIGDGVNDAPALAVASVGIAMGAIGSDTAIETADVALMQDDLGRLADAVRLGRRTLGMIRFNIAFALLVKTLFLILTFAGQASLWLAILADTGATLLVVVNSLRLLSDKWRRRPAAH